MKYKKNLFDNTLYFRLFHELAEFELSKELPIIPKGNGFWGSDKISRPFNSDLRAKAKMTKKEKDEYMWDLIGKVKGHQKSSSDKREKKVLQTILLRHYRKMTRYKTQLLEDLNEDIKSHPHFIVRWDKLNEYCINRLAQQFAFKKDDLKEYEEDLLYAIKSYLFYSHRFCKKEKSNEFSLNNLFDKIFYDGISKCCQARIFNKKEELICFPNPKKAKVQKYSPNISGRLSLKFFLLFIDYSLKKSGNYLIQEP